MPTVIHDLAERVAIAAVTKAYGPVDEKFQARFRYNFQARLELKERRYPIYEALDTAFHEVLEAGFTAAVATGAAFGRPQMQAGQGWNTPISEEWQNTIDEVATQAAYEHFDAARRLFDSGQPLPATERLTDAITASITAIAARKGWPHSNDTDIANAVTALVTGKMPDETADLYELMQSASDQGQDLFSAFGAAMGQPDAVRFAYYSSADGSDDAQRFAKATVQLANRIAGPTS